MPGSIQVSVLDFKELPSTSNSVNVSLGNTDYEAREKGTFSFPLMNMRDNLIITIKDSEGNQVSHSGVRTMSILEKGVWDDVFSIEGGGLIHMKLEFILSDEERNRIRSMRESAMKKKQAKIRGSSLRNADDAKFLASSLHQHQVSDILRATSTQDIQRSSLSNNTSFKASESSNGTKDESFQVQGQSFTNLEDKILSDEKKTNEQSTFNNNEFLLQQAEAPNKQLEDTKTQDLLKNNNTVKAILLNSLVEKKEQENLEDKNLSFLKKMSKDRKFPPFSQEIEVNKFKTNEIKLQETDLPKRLKDSSSTDLGSPGLTVAEKIKSFSPKLAGEMDKQASLEKSPQHIKKMISVFESSLAKDRVPFKPHSTKSNRFGSSSLLKYDMVKDCYEKTESNLKNSETSSSTRLRNSFSTGDLRKNLSGVIKKEDQVEFDDDSAESAEINVQSKGNDPNGTQKMPKAQVDKTMSLLSNSRNEEKCHQEKGDDIESSESADIESSTGSFGQAMKTALVIGFGVVVLLFRQRETR